MTEASRFVFVANRGRDGYQVPLALEETGLLATMVTDFYAPDSPPGWFPGILKARHVDGLSRRKATTLWLSFAMQALGERLRLPMRPILRRSDRMLARRAMAEARRRSANLYCYASYMPRAGEKPPGAKLIDFEFHPHPELTWDLLSADGSLYPEVAWSMAREEEDLKLEQVTEVWREADAVVCASAMTRRSLEHVGCPPERLTVVPYGFAPPPTMPDRRPEGPCRFLFVGQGISRKGLHHLIRAWQASPPPDAELTLVCYRIDPGIAALIDCPSITLLGRQDRAALDAIYARSDVFVMPSLVEGFGLVYLEALAAGCHVIGTENTGLPDLPLSTSAATILPPGDLDRLSGALHGAARRKAEGGFDAVEIAREAGKWQWAQFREAIAAHARSVLAG